jgi:tetratricopeptide (TPR) repeat protein
VYGTRAVLLRALGRAKAAAADEEKAGRPAATFLDCHLKAGELHRRGQWPQALDAFQSANRQRPEEYWTLFRLAKVLENLRRFSDAEKLFQTCIALRPADPTAYNNRGTVLLAQKDYQKAAAVFEAALARDPDYYPAYGNLMLAHAERKQVAEAEKVYRRYLARNPNDRAEHSRALVSLGLACERAGRFDKALGHYDAAVGQDADNALAHRNRALLLAHKGQDREAVQAIGKAIALEPKSGELRKVLGNLYAGQGHSSKARQAYDEAVKWTSGLWQAWYNRGVLSRRERDYERAVEDQTTALKLFPGCPEVLRERALALASLRRFEAALADVNRLNPADGDRGEVPLLRGKILGDMGRLKESEAELTRAITEAHGAADGYRSRGVTRMRAENWRGAIDDFQAHLKRAPDAADVANIHNDLSVAYLNLGKRDQAGGALKTA